MENLVPSEIHKIPIENTSITEIHFSEDIKIVRRNDTEHLVTHKIKVT